MKTLQNICLMTIALVALSSPRVYSQTADDAIRAFQKEDYKQAAIAFYNVLETTQNPSLVSEAQYGLAASFDKLNLNMAALKYYEDIAVVGSDHPYFDKAVEGLIGIAERVKDDFKIPAVIDALYDPNLSALEKLNSALLQRLHFVIGQHALNRGKIADALTFLNTVQDNNPRYPHAQYLLGLISLGVAQSDTAPNYVQAQKHFESVRNAINIRDDNKDRQDVRDLATLGLARSLYEQAYLLEDGDPKRDAWLGESIHLYKSIPRFSPAWSDSIFERAWAHTVANEYGNALGAIQSLESPYFTDSFYPEVRNLRAIIYYYNCQWDRVNTVIEQTKAELGPVVEQSEALLAQSLPYREWHGILEKSLMAAKKGQRVKGLIPDAIAYQIRADHKFQKMQRFLTELTREGEIFRKDPKLSSSRMGQEMFRFAADTKLAFLDVIGKYTYSRLKGLTGELSDITTRAALISLETKTAETEWLEQGRNIDGQIRKRLPRPFVPDETFQFWWFKGEHWIDELGYYAYTIKTECYE